MKPKEFIPAYERYIEKIILPKFPEILNFRVYLSSLKHYPFYGEPIPYIIVDFYVDDMEMERRHKVGDEIRQMSKYIPPEGFRLDYVIRENEKSEEYLFFFF